MDTIIRETLRPFGITRNYRGYPQTVRAIALVLEDESRLLNVTEEIYEVVALQTRCHPSNVERNIRTVVLCAWHTNRPLLVKMAGFTLTAPPRASQFIDIIASYCGATSFLRNSDKIYEKKRNASQAPGRRFWPSAAARTRTRSWRPLWTRWWPPGSLIVRSVGWRWTTRPTPCDCYCSKWGGM